MSEGLCWLTEEAVGELLSMPVWLKQSSFRQPTRCSSSQKYQGKKRLFWNPALLRELKKQQLLPRGEACRHRERMICTDSVVSLSLSPFGRGLEVKVRRSEGFCRYTRDHHFDTHVHQSF